MVQKLSSDEQAWLEGVGRRVRLVREEARLSQPALAKLIDMTKGTIWNIEMGVSGGNNIATLRKVAQVTAGLGTLPPDEDLIRRFLIGDVAELTVKLVDPNGSSTHTSYFGWIRDPDGVTQVPPGGGLAAVQAA